MTNRDWFGVNDQTERGSVVASAFSPWWSKEGLLAGWPVLAALPQASLVRGGRHVEVYQLSCFLGQLDGFAELLDLDSQRRVEVGRVGSHGVEEAILECEADVLPECLQRRIGVEGERDVLHVERYFALLAVRRPQPGDHLFDGLFVGRASPDVVGVVDEPFRVAELHDNALSLLTRVPQSEQDEE